MKLYSTERSGHAHTVRNLLSILDVSYTTVDVDTSNGETREEPFLTINPVGQIPVLDDDGFIVRDSHAILFYLANKYDEARTWFPKDLRAATRVQEWIATSTLDLVIGCAWARAAKQFRRNLDVEAAQKRAVRLLGLVDAHVAERTWLATDDHPTIADIAVYSYVTVAPEGGVEIGGYRNIQAWRGRVGSIPGFIEMPRAQ